MRRNARSITYYNNDGCERCEDLDKNLVAITASHTFSHFTRCDDDREAQLLESRKKTWSHVWKRALLFLLLHQQRPIQTGECVPKKNWTQGLNNFSNLFQTIISYLWPGAVEPCSTAWKNAEMKIKTGSWIKEQKFNIEIIQFESCKATTEIGWVLLVELVWSLMLSREPVRSSDGLPVREWVLFLIYS